MLLLYFSKKFAAEFGTIYRHFHLVEANAGGDVLISLFSDKEIKISAASICILDGDKSGNKKLDNRIISLPGNESPEKMFF